MNNKWQEAAEYSYNPLISIILPVFNCEQYLRRSIDSIVSQTYTNWECVLVDDESTDSSGEICDEYVRMDSRFRCIHQMNGGVAVSRQTGIDAITGEWSFQVDADDWMEPDTLNSMLEAAVKSGADIVITDYFIENTDGLTELRSHNLKDKAPRKVLSEIILGRCWAALWHIFIRTSVFKRYDVRFFPGLNVCEDNLVMAQILVNDVKVEYLTEAYYHYCLEKQDSMIRNYSAKIYCYRVGYMRKMTELLKGKGFDDVLNIEAFEIKEQACAHKLLQWKDFNRCEKCMRTKIRTIVGLRNYSFKKKCRLVFYAVLNYFLPVAHQ